MTMSGDPVPVTLLELLHNSLVLRRTVPYVPISGLLSLGAASKSFRDLLYQTPGVFRYLDLSNVKGAATAIAPIDVGGEVWRAERMDEALTEDDFYAGPLRGVFSNLRRKHVLGDVQTLVLDGLSVPADAIYDILEDTAYNVRILSIREVKNLNEKKLMKILRHCVRPSRPEGTPKLKGLYVFGPKDRNYSKLVVRAPGDQRSNTGVTSSEGAQLGMTWAHQSHEALSSAVGADEDMWYTGGRMLLKEPTREWAETVAACANLIAFDAVLCRGPRHRVRGVSADFDDIASADLVKLLETGFLPPAIATIALGPNGCVACHSSPEAPAVYGAASQAALPLLAPPPLHSSTVRAAQCPSSGITSPAKLLARCRLCLDDRWCERCQKYWCELCLQTRQFAPSSPPQAADALLIAIAARPIKVQLGLCVQGCLVSEMMAGAGSGGMW